MLLFLLLSLLAGSYGWGMRGALIGHGRGAMLPGAMLGLLFAVFSGNPLIGANAVFMAGVGACGMYFGGCLAYRQSTALIYEKVNVPRGYFAIAFKGGIWFGIFAAALGFGLRAVTGAVYGKTAMAVMCAGLPFVIVAGIKIFNRPYNLEKKIFPKIYFSITRPEQWGGYLLALVWMCGFAAAHGDWPTLVLTLFGVLSGVIGWPASAAIYMRSAFPDKNGKKWFSFLHKRNVIGTWKVLECSIGAFAGLITALGFWLVKGKYTVDFEGLVARKSLSPAFVYVWIALFLAFVAVLQVIRMLPPYRPDLERRKFLGSLYEPDYSKLMAIATDKKPARLFTLITKYESIVGVSLYAAFPLGLAYCGSYLAAELAAFFICAWVLIEQMALRPTPSFRHFKNLPILQVILVAAAALALAGHFLLKTGYSALACMLMYTLFYLLLQIMYDFRPKKWAQFASMKGEKNRIGKVFNGSIATTGWYIVCNIVLVVWALIKL